MKTVCRFMALALFITSICASAAGKHRHNSGGGHHGSSSHHHGRRHHKPEPDPVTAEICPSGEHAKRTRLTNYYTPVVSVARCDNGKNGLVNYNSKERDGEACKQSTIDGVVKRMEGAGVVLGASGEHLGVLVSPKGPLQEILDSGLKFSEVPPPGTPDEMKHVSGMNCPAGYGSKIDGKPVCLEPFKTVACAPSHAIGDVVFIPALVGIKYPRYPGEPREDYELYPGHDGYFYCGDVGSAIQGEHIDLFIGLINPYTADNPFHRFGSTSEYGVCWVPREEPARRYWFHSAIDLNPRFPGLSLGTLGNYLNSYLLGRAFGLKSWEFAP